MNKLEKLGQAFVAVCCLVFGNAYAIENLDCVFNESVSMSRGIERAEENIDRAAAKLTYEIGQSVFKRAEKMIYSMFGVRKEKVDGEEREGENKTDEMLVSMEEGMTLDSKNYQQLLVVDNSGRNIGMVIMKENRDDKKSFLSTAKTALSNIAGGDVSTIMCTLIMAKGSYHIAYNVCQLISLMIGW